MATQFGDGAGGITLDPVTALQAQYDGSPQIRAIFGQRPSPTNLAEIGNPIVQFAPQFNAWIGDLVNRIVMVEQETPEWRNPLDMFRSDMTPYGTDVQEIHTNPATANTFKPCDNAATLLACCPVDVAAVIHRLNREEQYCATVVQTEAEKAFTGPGPMGTLINGISGSLFNGNQIDQWVYTIKTVGGAIKDNKVGVIKIPQVTDEASGKGAIKLLKQLSYNFTLPSTLYNNYKRMQGAQPDRRTWTPRARQVILMRSDLYFNISIEVLASAFNMSMVELEQRIILVPEIWDNDGVVMPDVAALMCDITFIKIKDKPTLYSDFFNPKGWVYSYFLTPRELYSVSPFANATALVYDSAVTTWPTDFTPGDYT